jgi:hypothetical protein
MRGYQYRYFVVNTDLARLDYFMVNNKFIKFQYIEIIYISKIQNRVKK